MDPVRAALECLALVTILTYLCALAAFLLYVLIVIWPVPSPQGSPLRLSRLRRQRQTGGALRAYSCHFFWHDLEGVARTTAADPGHDGWRARQLGPRIKVGGTDMWGTATLCGLDPEISCCHFAARLWRCCSILSPRRLLAAAGSTQTSPLGFCALACLVGLFSEQAVLKLKQVAETAFMTVERGKD